MPSRLIWKGDDLQSKLARAVPGAIDKVTQDAADDAQGSHWWSVQSGTLESNIVNEPARRTGSLGWRGKFGSTAGAGWYGLVLEYRTPFLRPAGDRAFRHLADEIKRRLRWTS